MSKRYQGGILGVGFNPLRAPNAPTIGTASLTSTTAASVPVTAPSCVGGAPITSYTAISTPDCRAGTSASSPVAVSGLTNGTAYTFRVFATNSYGPSTSSAASNSVQTAVPGAPTIGTATVTGGSTASVAFTAPANPGSPATITGYQAISTPGCITATGASSPVVVSGLTSGTAYTFRVRAQNATGYGAYSSASNSVTPVPTGQQAYTTPGTYSWVAPAGVTSVSVVAVGGGGWCVYGNYRGGGGGLGYTNNIAVTPGSSYSVVVGAKATAQFGGYSSFNSNARPCAGPGGPPGYRGGYTGDGGGFGGFSCLGGGGAGGYSGNGGKGGTGPTAGSGGGGGGGGAGGYFLCGCCAYTSPAGAGGGVGLLGQGANGAAGACRCGQLNASGGTGGAGSGGSGSSYGGGGGYSFGGGSGNTGGGGAVRIIWPGTSRQFPSTNTGNV